MKEYSKRVISIIKNIPKGKVISYKQVSLLAGKPNGSRQVARLLHSCTKKYNLPWFRVVNSKLEISFKDNNAFLEQKAKLEKEGVKFSANKKIDKKFLWQIESIDDLDLNY